jgi:hypothetical protein
MSLNTGDIFEGIYQLEEKVLVGGSGQSSRWLADDITAYHRSEVFIDTIPADYVTDLHWQADRLSVKRIGQSAEGKCRYIVWEKDQAPPPIEKYNLPYLNDRTRKHLAGIIEALPVASHETLLAQEMPEYWHYGTDKILVFFRKATAQVPAAQLVREVKDLWKRDLMAPKPADSVPGESFKKETPKPSSYFWPIALSAIGVLLAVGVYSLRSQPNLESTSASRLMAFTDALERGIAYEQKAAYPDAIQSFETAVREAPASEMIDARLDSLARAYTAYAQAECARYQSTGSKQLYFIPDQYYHYASILSRSQTLTTCK